MTLNIENNVLIKATSEDGITDVVIPDGVTEIGHSAFFRVPLTSMTIPNTVTKIGITAFIRCGELTKLYLPDSVTDIGDKAFWCCENLITNRSIKQWDNKYGISKLDYALHYMRYYQSGDPFFDNVKAENDRYIKAQREKLIRKINVNDAAVVSYMTREGWLSADNIDYLLDKLGGNVEITAMLLDYKHRNFTDEYLEQRETDKFQKEVGIKERTLAEWKKIYQLGEDKEQGGYILKKYNGTDTDIIIPDHIAGKPVTRIGKRCFSPMSTTSYEVRLVREKIRSVYIPDTVTCIEEGAFQQCFSLAEITIPNSAVTIGNAAFNLCQSLTEIAIPDNIKEISGAAFADCYALKRVTLPKGLKTIGDSAFINCKALAKIEIPETVIGIERFAFSGCVSLTEITLPKGITSIEPSTFDICEKLERVTLPDGLTRIEHFAFAECPNLNEIFIPASVTLINEMSFWITNVVITAQRGSYAVKFAKEHHFEFKEI